MPVLSPGDRARMWHDTLHAGPESRDSQVRGLALAAFEALGFGLDLYSREYAQACVESFVVLDASGLIGRDTLRQSFEDVDEQPATARHLAYALAAHLREAALIERLEEPQRDRAMELAKLWRTAAEETARPETEAAGMETISVAEVAAKYDVTVQAVYKWIAKGAIEFRQTPGGSYRIPVAQFARSERFDRQRARRLQNELAKDRDGTDAPEPADVVEEVRTRRKPSR